VTNVPGSSDYFLGGIISYANGVKERLLGVRRETLGKFGSVSEETVREMARGARQALQAEIGLAISGIAGPGGGTAEKPVGLVWIGLSAPDGEQARRFLFAGDRAEVKSQAAQAALQLLVDYLRGARSD
jgi:PncC family amidohydrolase